MLTWSFLANFHLVEVWKSQKKKSLYKNNDSLYCILPGTLHSHTELAYAFYETENANLTPPTTHFTMQKTLPTHRPTHPQPRAP